MKDGLYERRLRTECHSVLRFLGVLMFVACFSVSAAAGVVRAELGKETAWTGEAVPLLITLYSPGPFSGTASFELPELPKSVFVRTGNPLVGSEQIGGESYFTQRHEFAIYTQRAGKVVIPAFLVRFSGKKSFTSAAEPVAEYTPELTFQSTRPPGTEQLGVVVAARNMEVSQTWQPDARGPVQAGDVIARTIARRANGTTAMLLPSLEIETPAGVRCYATDPIVQDNTERGASLAARSDTIKYQFERAGTFPLPAVLVVWWDPEASALKRVSLPGKMVEVLTEAPAAEPLSTAPQSRWRLFALLLTIGVAAGVVRKPVMRLLAARQLRRDDPATAAAARLVQACRTNAAADAYAAVLQWKRAVNLGDMNLSGLLPPDAAAQWEHEWSVLSRRVFGVGPGHSPWRGQRLHALFALARRKLSQAPHTTSVPVALPALNPTVSRDGG